MKFTNSIEIARPVEDVFEYVSDITKGSEWDSAVLKITKLSEGEVRKGATYRMTRELPGGEAENILEVVELVPNHEMALQTTSGLLRSCIVICLSPSAMGPESPLKVNLCQRISAGMLVALLPFFLIHSWSPS